MAADFHFPPAVLKKTGWLQLVNGSLHATGQRTGKGVEDDYFVVDRGLHAVVLGVALINDTEAKPQSAVACG